MPSNRWNRIVYRAWAPVYDELLERFFRPGREAAAAAVALRSGERVLLVGVGTGQDLPLVPPGVDVVGVDTSPAMLAHARRRAAGVRGRVELRVRDATETGLVTGSVDAAVLSLVLSVVPDPAAVLAETLRVVRPGGRAVVFDKFAPGRAPLTAPRRLLNAVTRFVGTEIDRRFADLVDGSGWTVVSDSPSLLRGQYRVILLRRDGRP